MDESDADQILAIDELRALRDRIGAERAAPASKTTAAPLFQKAQAPEEPSAESTLEADEDPWESLRRQAQDRRRWGRLVAAGGCLALTGGAVAVLLITAHNRSGAPVAPVPTVSAVPVNPPPPVNSAAPVTPAASGLDSSPASSAQPSAVLPMPDPVAPSATAPSAPADDATTPQPVAVPAPGATQRAKPPTAPATRRPPEVAPADGWAPGAGADRVDTPHEPAGSPEATLTRTPTSWSPESPQ